MSYASRPGGGSLIGSGGAGGLGGAVGGPKRYMDSQPSDNRYADRSSGGGTGGSQPWNTYSSSSVQPKSFSMPMGGGGGGGGPPPDNWRSMHSSNQDRYDRTYNERKLPPGGAPQYMDGPRQNSFMGRTQDRY